MTEIARIAEGLTRIQKQIALSLCGNAWEGAAITPGLVILQGLGLMRITQLGKGPRFKASPTAVGKAVREYLLGSMEKDG